MKKLFIICSLFFCSAKFCQAQTFAEWFEQKKTEIKYYLAQIAALAAVKTDIENGIKIAQQGLDFISEMKKGELDLHTAFFNSLEAINPAIAKYGKVADIITYQIGILRDWNKAMARFNASKQFSPGEMAYLNAVYSNMSTECSKTLDELINVITPNVFEMKDDERIKRIDGIYGDMQSKYAFTKSFTSQSTLLLSQRLGETNEVETSRELNGLK
jgi:hypothetical protein